MGRMAVTAFLVVLLLGMGASPLWNAQNESPLFLEERKSPLLTSNLQMTFQTDLPPATQSPVNTN
jgi:hypothetical protein